MRGHRRSQELDGGRIRMKVLRPSRSNVRLWRSSHMTSPQLPASWAFFRGYTRDVGMSALSQSGHFAVRLPCPLYPQKRTRRAASASRYQIVQACFRFLCQPSRPKHAKPVTDGKYELGSLNLASTFSAPSFESKSQVGPHACRQHTHQESSLVNSWRFFK